MQFSIVISYWLYTWAPHCYLSANVQLIRNQSHSILTSFVEDRLATLKNVIKEPELDGWNLYLGTLSLSLSCDPYPMDGLFIVNYFGKIVGC